MSKAAEDVNIELKSRAILKAALNVLDKFFTIIFVFEMFVKICAYGFRKYFTDAWCWLDFIIVAVSRRSSTVDIPSSFAASALCTSNYLNYVLILILRTMLMSSSCQSHCKSSLGLSN